LVRFLESVWDAFRGRQFFLERIYLLAMFPKAVAYVGAAGIAGHPNPADDIALFYILSLFDVSGFHVQVLGAIDVVMLYFYIFAIATALCGFGNDTVGGRQNGGANARGKIGAFVGPQGIAVVSNAPIEIIARGNATELYGCFQEGAFQAF